MKGWPCPLPAGAWCPRRGRSCRGRRCGARGWAGACLRGWPAGGRRGRYTTRARLSRTWPPRSLWAGTAWPISRCCGSSRSSRGRPPRTRSCLGWSACWPETWPGHSRSPGNGGPSENATSKARGKQAWTSTRSGPGTLCAGTPCCPWRPGAAGHRRGPPGPVRRGVSRPRRQPAARGLARHGQAACRRRRPATGRRPWAGQGQRARGPPPPPAGHHADEPGRPRPRLRLVTMATAPSGPRAMAPLPCPAQSRPRRLTIAGKKGPSYNKPGRSAGRPRTRRTRVLPGCAGLGHASGQHRESSSGQVGQGSRAARDRHEDRFGRAGHLGPAAP